MWIFAGKTAINNKIIPQAPQTRVAGKKSKNPNKISNTPETYTKGK